MMSSRILKAKPDLEENKTGLGRLATVMQHYMFFALSHSTMCVFGLKFQSLIIAIKLVAR